MTTLEQLLVAYDAAIAARDGAEIDRLCVEVEREADRVQYSNHGRLKALHTRAEAAVLIELACA